MNKTAQQHQQPTNAHWLNPNWQYIPADSTDIRQTFARLASKKKQAKITKAGKRKQVAK